MIRVLAHRGEGVYLVVDGDRGAVVDGRVPAVLGELMDPDAILMRGYWEDLPADDETMVAAAAEFERVYGGSNLLYQVIEGRVFTLKRGGNGATERGEVDLQAVKSLVGDNPREGWYDASGRFVGDAPPGRIG